MGNNVVKIAVIKALPSDLATGHVAKVILCDMIILFY
jgi:hypothetical protein